MGRGPLAALAGIALLASVHDARAELLTPTSERVASPPVSDAVVAARVAEFVRRNPGWLVSQASSPWVRHAARVGGATSVTLTREQAKAHAVAFLSRNADLVGVQAAELARLTATVSDGVVGSVEGDATVAHVVRFEGRGIVQPGFDRFRVFERSIDLAVYVFSDGAVGKLDASVRPAIPPLRMRPTPKIPANDPRIPGAVVGRFVFRYEHVGVNRTTGMRQHQRYGDGNVSAAEVQGVKLDVVEDAIDGGVVYSLVYEVTVLHRDRTLVFRVDPDNASVLRDPTPPGEILP